MDELLNEVNYDFTGYMPSNEALMVVNFIKEVNGGSEDNKTPLMHLKVLDMVCNTSARDIIVAHRGFAKSSLMEYLILFNAGFGYFPGFGKASFIMYVSDSIENGVKTLRKNIQFKYENSKFLQQLIPNKKLTLVSDEGSSSSNDFYEEGTGGRKFTDVRMEFENVKGIRTVVKGFGVSTGIRGTRELGQRPSIALLDDLMRDEDARSDTVISSIEDVVYKAVSKALHPTRQKIIWTGTPFNAKDPLYRAVESGSWDVTLAPICEQFPVSKKDFRGSWEDRFPYEYVKREYDEAMALQKPENFNQELMLRVTSLEDRLIRDECIKYFDEATMLKSRSYYNFYITTDLATTVRQNSDYSVITVWAINSAKQYMAIDGFCARVEVSEFIEELFRLCSKYKPMLGVGIEVTGQQGGFISWIQQEMVRKKVYFPLASSNNKGSAGIRPIADKFSRFVTFSPEFTQGNIWIGNKLKASAWGLEFQNEISKATKTGFKSRHDDVLDTISMLQAMNVFAPSDNSYEGLDKDEKLFYEDEEGLGDIQNTIF